MDIGYLMAWSNLAQWLWLLVLAPLNLIPTFGTVTTVPDLIKQYLDSMKCFLGTETSGITEHCDEAWYLFSIFVFFYCVANFAMAALVKYGNATFSILTSISSSIIAVVAFSLHFVMGQDTQQVTVYDWVALVVVLLGVVLYRITAYQSDEIRDFDFDREEKLA